MTDNKKLYKVAFGLAVFTIVYNIVEGLISTYLGFEDESLALFGFGLFIIWKWFQNLQSGSRSRRARYSNRRNTRVFRGFEFRAQRRDWARGEVLKPFLSRTRRQPGLVHNLGHLFFPFNGHDMDPADPFQFTQLRNCFQADRQTFIDCFFFSNASWAGQD